MHGTDLLIDGKHVPDGGTVELDLDGYPHLARWLEPVDAKAKGAANNDKGDKA